MSEYDNLPTEPFTPTGFRDAIQRLRAMRDTPQPLLPDSLFLGDDWILDWDGLRKDDPQLFASMMQSTSENNGQCIMPVEVWQSLVERGYLMYGDEG